MFKSLTANLTSGGKLPVSFRTDPDAPKPIRRAVRLMYAGGAVSVISLILTVISSFSLKNALITHNAQLLKNHKVTMSQLDSLATATIVYAIGVATVAVALWIWMAKKNEAGRLWARITSTVLFALWSFYTYTSINSLRGGTVINVSFIINFALVLALWIIGLATIYLLWLPDSTAYFKTHSRTPR